MAICSFLVGLVVAWTTKVVASIKCDKTDAECVAATPNTANNPSIDCDDGGCTEVTCCKAKCSLDDSACTTNPGTKNNGNAFCAGATCDPSADEAECCQPSCLSTDPMEVACGNGTDKAASETFCAMGTQSKIKCTTAYCCTVTLGQCVIGHCTAVNGTVGEKVLKTPVPSYCGGADCTADECCEAAGVCDANVCTGTANSSFMANKSGTYCLGATCDPLRECCEIEYVIAAPSLHATSLQFDNVDNINVGDTILFANDITVYTVTGVTRQRRLDEERRLGAGSVSITPAINQGTINSGSTTVVVSPGGNPSAVSDPITFYKGYKTKFWLPNDKLTLLLETKDIKVYVSVLEGPSEDLQWFGRFFVFNSDGSKLCDIDVNRNEIRSPDSFEQIVIKLGNSDTPLPAQIQTYGSTDGKVKFSISTMPWNTPGDFNFTHIQDLVYFETDDLVFTILPSHAGNEFPTSKLLALKYMHLDLVVHEMKGEEQFGGILPEFWGLKARSEEAYAMLTKPSRSRALSGDDCGTCNGAPFWE